MTGLPTNYADEVFGESDPGSTSGGNCTLASANRAKEAASEDPDTFTWTGITTDEYSGVVSIGPA